MGFYERRVTKKLDALVDAMLPAFTNCGLTEAECYVLAVKAARLVLEKLSVRIS